MVLEWIILIFLILFGLSLIVAEVIIVPGTTFVGILGFLITAAGVYMGYTTFGETTGLWVLVISVVVGVGAIIYGLQSNTWNRFSLNSTSDSRFNDEFAHQLQVGATGRAISELRPQGKAEFEEKIYEVRSFGQYLESGTEVRIAKIDSHIIFVEPLSLYK